MSLAEAGPVAAQRPPPVSEARAERMISRRTFCLIESLTPLVAPPDAALGGTDGAARHPPPKSDPSRHR
jgi:hypothetical protein